MSISSLPPSKKRKIGHADDKSSKIQQLEAELDVAIIQNSSLNALVDLLRIPQTATDPQLCSKAIYALYRIFVSLVTSGRLALRGDESAKVVRAWIWERLDAYTDLLVSFLSDEKKSLRVSSSVSSTPYSQSHPPSDFGTPNSVFAVEASFYIPFIIEFLPSTPISCCSFQ